MDHYYIGVDLGGTNIRACLATGEGKILKRAEQRTLALEGPGRVVPRIFQTIRQVMTDSMPPRAIGLDSPGPLDPWKGIIIETPNLPGWHNVPLKDLLQKEFGIPSFVNNDANVAALAEHRYGAGRAVRNLIYLTISTGIGGGIIIDGKVFVGAKGNGGEVGHQILDPNGPPCNSGHPGDLEGFAAGPSIARHAREELTKGRESKIRELVHGDISRVSAVHVVEAAREGDEFAREEIERAGFYIGLGLVNLLHMFDTELFVLGGGVIFGAGEMLFEPIRATFDKYAFKSMKQGVLIVPAALGEDVALLGSVALAVDETRASGQA
ncbi:MAG TPA: ROK family protein [Anaerolineae bacterium]